MSSRGQKREEDARKMLTSGAIGDYLYGDGMTEAVRMNLQPLRSVDPEMNKSINSDVNMIPAKDSVTEVTYSETKPRLDLQGSVSASPRHASAQGFDSLNMSKYYDDGNMGAKGKPGIPPLEIINELDPALRRSKYDIIAANAAPNKDDRKSVAATKHVAAEASHRWTITLRTDIPQDPHQHRDGK
jgi:hypothetical protein